MSKQGTYTSPAEKYRGMTKRRYKRAYGSSTPGSEKGYNCHALPNEKGLIKYPRTYKTFPREYREVNARKQVHFNTTSAYFRL